MPKNTCVFRHCFGMLPDHFSPMGNLADACIHSHQLILTVVEVMNISRNRKMLIGLRSSVVYTYAEVVF